MRKMHVLASVLALTMSISLLTACGSGNKAANGGNSAAPNNTNGAAEAPAEAKDTITALLPPVSGNFQSRFEEIEKDFNALYPNLTLKIEPASWEDMTQKLDTQVNAGSPQTLPLSDRMGSPNTCSKGC